MFQSLRRDTLRTALIVGNGFTKSLIRHVNFHLDSSNPLRWDIASPGKSIPLMDELPNLKDFIDRNDPNLDQSDFALFDKMVDSALPVVTPASMNPATESAVLDSGHYLAIAYSHFQLAIDKLDFRSWDWQLWLSAVGGNLSAVLSWNYDLVVELVLARCGFPYYYPGASTTCEEGNVDYSRTAIPISKPHGSCNFSSMLNWNAIGDHGHPISLAYPRQIDATGADGPLKCLRRDQLLTVRAIADLVLPGEVNRFHRSIKWVDDAITTFASKLIDTDHLVIVGFSMMECDQKEFLRALGDRTNITRITVVNPDPNPKLLNELNTHTVNSIEVLNYSPPS